MRSIASSAMPPTAGAPLVPALSRTPSTRTRTCEEFAPRKNSDAAVPRPPDCANCTPVSRDSRLTMSTLWVRSMSARVMTDVAGSASSIACVCRAGVITVIGSCEVACASAVLFVKTKSVIAAALPRAGEPRVDIVTPAHRPAAGKVHTRTGRESAGQGAERARPAGTPRLVLLPMAGLRAAGSASRLPASRDAVAVAKRAKYAPAYRCGGSTGWDALPQPPVSRFTEVTRPSAPLASGSLSHELPRAPSLTRRSVTKRGATIAACSKTSTDSPNKVHELARLVQSLRTENQQLRSQLVQAGGELDAMRHRVDEAGRRLDVLMERLPGHASSAKAPWNT